MTTTAISLPHCGHGTAHRLAQRLHHAEELLELRDLPVEEVARRSGFGTALREQFVRRRGVPHVTTGAPSSLAEPSNTHQIEFCLFRGTAGVAQALL
ncbi:hypothetical protein ACIA8K_13165 [Catenuloplanes sp. NPDC051500]|uniref:hypothetical protein n=1 Tax=Catenuloplanes sp. NPDC051500 TaxID=3363959 RepID=UPI0037AAC432